MVVLDSDYVSEERGMGIVASMDGMMVGMTRKPSCGDVGFVCSDGGQSILTTTSA